MDRRRLLRPFILVIFALPLTTSFISGCSIMNGIMSSWEGQHIDSVVAQWGYPDEKRDFQGKTLYVWYQNGSFYTPQSSTTTGRIYGNSIYAQTSYSGGYTTQLSCTRILEVDKKGCVVRWQWNGNNCPFLEVFGYSNWRNKNNRTLGYAAKNSCGCGEMGLPEETKKVSEETKPPKDQNGSVTNPSEKQSRYEPTPTDQKVSTNKPSEEASVENLGRYSGHKETCSICGKTIPKLEQHFMVDEKVVCKGCFTKQKNQKPVAKN